MINNFVKQFLWKTICKHRIMLILLLLYSIITFLVYMPILSEAVPHPAQSPIGTYSSSSSSSSSRILIWPNEIEDNALTKQNGEFVFKQATAAEKQEQKSSSSIFFWPSSHGGNHHHHRPSRNYSASIHLSTCFSTFLLMMMIILQVICCGCI